MDAEFNALSSAKNNSVFRAFMKIGKIRNRLITKFSVHLATTFAPKRVVAIVDSISSYVKEEALYCESRVFKRDSSQWIRCVQSMRNFAKQRPDFMYALISKHFNIGDSASFRVHSDLPDVRYIFNEEPVKVSDMQTKFYNGLNVSLTAIAPDGYRFGHWEISGDSVDGVYVDTSAVLNATFMGATAYKAVFEEDPSWNKDVPKLYLNEICASNKQYVDEFRESDDWIEIYNDGSSPVNIGGMYISDARNNLKKFQIVDTVPHLTTIPAGGYLTLWADGTPAQGVLHTGFKLPNSKKETVSLSKMVGDELVVIDSIRYKPHVKGETYARFSCEGDGDWCITSIPTFRAENKFAPRLAANVEPEETVPNDSVGGGNEAITGEFAVVADVLTLSVYPNIVADELYFRMPWNVADIWIMDGIRTLLSVSVANGGSVDVTSLPSGFYMVIARDRNSGAEQVVKFVKK